MSYVIYNTFDVKENGSFNSQSVCIIICEYIAIDFSAIDGFDSVVIEQFLNNITNQNKCEYIVV